MLCFKVYLVLIVEDDIILANDIALRLSILNFQ